MKGKVLRISTADRGADAAADDFKYICGLSTILVDTIQEVKDRVSQTEFICSQLFPRTEAMSKLLHARHADDVTATKAAEDDWRKREAGLVSQLEELSGGKRRAEDRVLQLESSLEEMKGKLVDAARLAAEHDAEKKQLLGRLEELDRRLRLESSFEEIKGKFVDAARLVTEHDAEKKQLLGRLEEEMKDEVIGRLNGEIGDKAAEISREREAYQLLLHQMESKDNDLLLAQNKVDHVDTKYKDLKSQYNDLLKKKIDQNDGVPESNVNRKSSGRPPSKRKLKDLQDTEKESIQLVSKTEDQKNASSSSPKAQQTPHDTSARSRLINSRLSLPSHPTDPPDKNAANSTSKTDASSSFFRPSHWRETRARKEPGVVDPHDDFLDTRLEAVRNTIRNPTTREEAPALAALPPQEPVRKKADRENLKGVECKQCKKFYDVVLPDGRVNGNGMDSTSMRCEHHDGVSRYRYRYALPSTPEGFWNIAFE